jgi:hypothetical protein
VSVLAVYQSTCKFCKTVKAVLKQSLHVTADLLASLENANQAALAASRGDHEKAKAIISNG